MPDNQTRTSLNPGEPPKTDEEITTEWERQRVERANLQSELTSKNYPPAKIKEILDQKYPDLSSVDMIESQAVKQFKEGLDKSSKTDT